ncbi:hypothetical protein JCM5353_007612 [Sporobolomyces roseus]
MAQILEAKQRGRPYSDSVRAAGAMHPADTREDTERMAAEAHQREKEEEKHNMAVFEAGARRSSSTRSKTKK